MGKMTKAQCMIDDRNMVTALNRRSRVGMAEHLEKKRLSPNPQDLLSELAEVSMQGIIVLGPYNIEFCNDRARELNGVPKSILDVDKPWMAFFQYQLNRGDFGEGEAGQAFFVQLLDNFKERKVMQVERSAANGRIVRADRVPNSLGGMTLTLTDITELKARETELRAIGLAAQAAEQAKSEFLANMSHELRTPLNGILGMAEVLSSSVLDADQKEAAGVILSSAEALVHVVDDVLEVSKLDLGTVSFQPQPFDLSQMVRDLVAEFTAAAFAKGIGLHLRLSEELPPVVGDGRLLRQALTHLLDNAVRFTAKGKVDVILNCADAEADRLAVEIVVRDTGIGITQKDQARIFDRFSQVESNLSRSHDGAGLGLSLVQAYAEIMGGSVKVESALGDGATFTMALQLEAVSDDSARDADANG